MLSLCTMKWEWLHYLGVSVNAFTLHQAFSDMFPWGREWWIKVEIQASYMVSSDTNRMALYWMMGMKTCL